MASDSASKWLSKLALVAAGAVSSGDEAINPVSAAPPSEQRYVAHPIPPQVVPPDVEDVIRRIKIQLKDMDKTKDVTPKQIQNLITQLGHDKYAQREIASRELEAIGYTAIPQLKEALEHTDSEIAQRSTYIFQNFGSRVSDLLETAKPAGEIGSKAKSAVPVLASLLSEEPKLLNALKKHGLRKGDRVDLGEGIVGILEKIGPETTGVAPALVDILHKDDSARVKLAAAVVLSKRYRVVGRNDFIGRPGYTVEEVGVLPALAPTVIPAFGEVLRNEKDPSVRMRTALALRGVDVKAEPALPGLIAALKDEKLTAALKNGKMEDEERALRTEVIKEAIWAIGNTGTKAKAAVPGLIEHLKHSDASVRWYAAWSLGRNLKDTGGPGTDKAVRALIPLLENEDYRTTRDTIISLGLIGDGAKAALPALKKFAALENKAESWELEDCKKQAKDAIMAIEARQKQSSFFKALKSPDALTHAQRIHRKAQIEGARKERTRV